MSDYLAINRGLLLERPDLIKDIKAEAKATLDLAKYIEHLLQLRKYGDWNKFDWSVMKDWANSIDEPFVKLMLSLARRGYTYNCISMHKWWRRLKAVNQQHIITFFSYQGFIPLHIKKHLYYTDVYMQCCRIQDIFDEYIKVYTDDNAVEMNLRALLGISQKRDIKEAWVEWAKSNHPDKGGSVDKFVLVKSAYEEWQYGQHK